MSKICNQEMAPALNTRTYLLKSIGLACGIINKPWIPLLPNRPRGMMKVEE